MTCGAEMPGTPKTSVKIVACTEPADHELLGTDHFDKFEGMGWPS